MLTYEEYKINSLNPRNKDIFHERKNKGFSLEKMIILDYKLLYPKGDDYVEYREWCEKNSYTPYSKTTFGKYKESTYNIHHNSVESLYFDGRDRIYIDSFSLRHTERKSYINQYFCLFWKNYFMRKKKKQEQ